MYPKLINPHRLQSKGWRWLSPQAQLQSGRKVSLSIRSIYWWRSG